MAAGHRSCGYRYPVVLVLAARHDRADAGALVQRAATLNRPRRDVDLSHQQTIESASLFYSICSLIDIAPTGVYHDNFPTLKLPSQRKRFQKPQLCMRIDVHVQTRDSDVFVC